MTFLIDTGVWIGLFKDRDGSYEQLLYEAVGDADTVSTPAVQMELLRGARDDAEWKAIETVLEREVVLPITQRDWIEAAAIYFDMRRQGLTVNSTMDCLIAQSAIGHGVTLLHNDKDYDRIALVRELKHKRMEIPKA